MGGERLRLREPEPRLESWERRAPVGEIIVPPFRVRGVLSIKKLL